MRSWAIFLYGASVGLFLAWLTIFLIDTLDLEWLLIGAAFILAIALLVHQRFVSLSKGRRWKKTT